LSHYSRAVIGFDQATVGGTKYFRAVYLGTDFGYVSACVDADSSA
jgi:hypothetical protein